MMNVGEMVRIIGMRRTEFEMNDAGTLVIRQYDKPVDQKPNAVVVIPDYAIKEFIYALDRAVSPDDIDYDADVSL